MTFRCLSSAFAWLFTVFRLLFIRYGSINLRHGVDDGESNVTATATVGTMTLEFWQLSHLTGDDRFARAVKK